MLLPVRHAILTKIYLNTRLTTIHKAGAVIEMPLTNHLTKLKNISNFCPVT